MLCCVFSEWHFESLVTTGHSVTIDHFQKDHQVHFFLFCWSFVPVRLQLTHFDQHWPTTINIFGYFILVKHNGLVSPSLGQNVMIRISKWLFDRMFNEMHPVVAAASIATTDCELRKINKRSILSRFLFFEETRRVIASSVFNYNWAERFRGEPASNRSNSATQNFEPWKCEWSNWNCRREINSLLKSSPRFKPYEFMGFVIRDNHWWFIVDFDKRCRLGIFTPVAYHKQWFDLIQLAKMRVNWISLN